MKRLNKTILAMLLLVGLSLTGFLLVASAQESANTPDEMEELVGRVALYPDDLLSILLPASTFPLQIVEADRWIQKNEGNADAKPKDSWDDSVKALINYPEVISMMSEDLDWTSAMGEAVVADQTAVMDSVQSFRRKAEGAGNLKSDDKQTVAVEEEVVKIVQADPQVIYVPQYEPTVVVVQQQVPVYPTYYPYAYPVYYYPYPPGYAFARGVFWGATMAYAFDWHHGGIHHDIDIDIDRNINRNTNRNIDSRATNIDRDKSQRMAQEGRGTWQSKQSPSDVRQGRTSQASTRSGQATQRASGQTGRASPARNTAGTGANRATPSRSTSGTAANRGQSGRSSYSRAQQHSTRARQSTPSRNAFSGMSSGRSAGAYSSRGSMSRGRSGGGRRR
jgi:hypothetical protein